MNPRLEKLLRRGRCWRGPLDSAELDALPFLVGTNVFFRNMGKGMATCVNDGHFL